MFTTTIEGTVSGVGRRDVEAALELQCRLRYSCAPPMTYSVNGKQYVAVLIGGQETCAEHAGQVT